MPNNRAIWVVSNFWVSRNCKSAGLRSKGTYFRPSETKRTWPAWPSLPQSSFNAFNVGRLTFCSVVT